MLPILAFTTALILLPAAILHAVRKREQYCGKGPDPVSGAVGSATTTTCTARIPQNSFLDGLLPLLC
jgi:hypothetical protein